MKLSKEQQAVLVQQLSSPWGSVRLMCDGYRVDLQVARASGMTFRVMTYVNGTFKGLWCSDSEVHPEQNFLRKSVKPLVSAAKRAKAEKVFGKRAVAKDEYFQKKIVFFMPDWASGKAAISHLCKVCESVEIVD